MSDAYIPAVIPPDPERDKRVAARRAADARRAGSALDILIYGEGSRRGAVETAYYAGWNAGYAASTLQHNRHYGVSHPAGNCGPLALPLAAGSRCPTCGELTP